MVRLHRPTAALVSALLVISLFGAPVARGDELSDAKDRLSTLQGEASQAEEDYNEAKARLEAAQVKLQEIKDDVAIETEKTEALRDHLAIVTLQQFQDRGVSSAAVLLTSADQDEALTRIIVSTMVADTTLALLQAFQLSQGVLLELEREQQAVVDIIRDEQARMQALKEEAATKVAEAQALVDRLTAEQQAALWGNPWASGVYGPPPPVQNGAAAAAIVAWAMARVGLPYVYGGSGPRGYDCSGFTMMAYASVGIRLPHGSASQFNYGYPVSKSQLAPGDLVFFYGGPGHVGIYVGGGMIVDARNEGTGVVYTPLETGMPFVGARRLL